MAVVNDREQILAQIEEHRTALATLESRLRAAEPPAAPWPPRGFYLTFYVVAGLLLGILGSLTSFLFNVFGSLLVNQDPLHILRVYGTVFLGAKALTTDDLNFFMLVAVVHFSLGAVAGAVFHVLVNRFVPDRPAFQIVLGGLYGLLIWVVNFYCILDLAAAASGRRALRAGAHASLDRRAHPPRLRADPRSAAAPRTIRAVPSGGGVMRAATILLVGAALAAPVRAADPGDGAVVYGRYCVGCHGASGDGNGPRPRRC